VRTYHLTWVGTASDITLCVDGNPVDTNAHVVWCPRVALGLDGESFVGLLDDVRVYNRALGAAEVDAIYREGGGASGPTIDSHPADQNALDGDPATFTVAATTSGGALHYQWYQDGSPVGADSDTFTIVSCAETMDGDTIHCIVSDDNGSATSRSAPLTVSPRNQDAMVSVAAPADGSIFFEGIRITFTGSASDPEDGDLTAGLIWSSDRDGQMGTGASAATSALSVGTHVVTASATDLAGAEATRSISVVIESSATCPYITGGPTATPAVILSGGTTTLSVSAADLDGDTLSYSWIVLAGPGTCSFTPNGSTSSDTTTAAPSAFGAYTMQVTVSDSSESVTATVDMAVVTPTSDLDNDGVTSADEIIRGTDPDDPDTDADGMPDGWELDNGLDPLTDDSANDPDGDGRTNAEEHIDGTDPFVIDGAPADYASGPALSCSAGESEGPRATSFAALVVLCVAAYVARRMPCTAHGGRRPAT